VRRLNRFRQKKKEEAEDHANDDLDDGMLRQELAELGDKWEENKQEKESIEVFNYKTRSIKFLKSTVKGSLARKALLDESHDLQIANLTDSSKVPREVISELFEAS
jgi:hypothetical protein